jgi:subtilase family serine protease
MAMLAGCLILAPAAMATKPLKAGTYYAKGEPVCQVPKKAAAFFADHRSCFAMKRVFVTKGTPGSKQVTVDATPTPGPAGGLTPAELASAYGFTPTGSGGLTVAIVDAFNDPNIEADLGTFDTQYGLPACTKANGCLKVVSQTGSTVTLPANDTTGWAVEEALDVESVRAVCRDCKILLVEANDNSNANLDIAENEAVTLGAKVITNSFGGPESSLTTTDRAAYNHPGIVITASTGDNGWYAFDRMNVGGVSSNMPEAPASLNTVVAVGGTTLDLTQTGTRASESVWNNDGPSDYYGFNFGLTGATGGGCSTLNSPQNWQSHVAGWAATTCGTHRLDADIAAVGDPLTGFDVYNSYNCGGACTPGWGTIGGTSLASPVIAAMWGLAGGNNAMSYPSVVPYGHLADATPTLYDVQVGGNGYCDGKGVGQCDGGASGPINPNAYGYGFIDCDYSDKLQPGTPATGLGQCDAAPGYDGPSGVGTPKSINVFKRVGYARITLPTLLPVGVSETFSGAASKDPYPGGSITSYTWKWGDGTANSTGVTASHTYAAAGTYQLTLSENETYGATSSLILNVTLGAKPVAVITAPASVTHGVSATFSGASSTDSNTGGKITSYKWHWGDGTADTTTSSSSTTHTFAVAGNYNMTLTVTDNYGNVSNAAARSQAVG